MHFAFPCCQVSLLDIIVTLFSLASTPSRLLCDSYLALLIWDSALPSSQASHVRPHGNAAGAVSLLLEEEHQRSKAQLELVQYEADRKVRVAETAAGIAQMEVAVCNQTR